eukprot:Hpha_TRINITY_DN16102_c2_g1::TRINITY_DN16102_c2_g1_i1::g.5586::m.5586
MTIWRRFFHKCSHFIMRESDSPEDVRIKRAYTPVAICFLVAVVLLLARDTGGDHRTWILRVAYILIIVSDLQFLIQGFLGRRMGTAVDIVIVLKVISLLLWDVGLASDLRSRSWSTVIILLDAALVFHTPRTIPLVLFLTLGYLLVERVEAGMRFGLYHLIQPNTPVVCDCADPPCAKGIMYTSSGYGGYAIVLLIDFYLTRGFATDLGRQVRSAEVSVRVAKKIAGALARYDVEEAEMAISSGENLDDELAESYLRLLHNLRLYRDYLPDALLQQDDSGGRDRVPPPVGQGEQDVDMGIVFTDIQSSTRLWEAYPQGMHEALSTHNTTLRKVANEHQGYEVKIIGDALMLAFGTAKNA